MSEYFNIPEFDLFKSIILFFCFFLFVSAKSEGQKIFGDYEIALWKGFKKSAISFTFDDGTLNQFNVALPLFNQFGYKFTLYPILDWFNDWTILQKTAESGHEIGSHTITHPHLNELSPEEQEKELRLSQEMINQNIKNQKCLTIAYPFCIPAIPVLCAKYYIGARGCQGYIEKSTPDDMLNISAIPCGEFGPVNSKEKFIETFENAFSSEGWAVFLIHGIDNDGGYSSLDSSVLKEALEYLKENDKKFWVATFRDVVLYITERNNVSINEISKNTNSIKFLFSHNLDTNIYNFPLTLKFKLPEKWKNVKVLQGKNYLNSEIVKINNKKYVIFDVVPLREEIILIKVD